MKQTMKKNELRKPSSQFSFTCQNEKIKILHCSKSTKQMDN